MTPEQKNQINQWIQEACKILGIEEVAQTLVIGYNPRLVRCIGRARYVAKTNNYHIEFSVPLWKLVADEKRRNTVIHELCHVADHIKNGYMGHKKTWKDLMVLCGELPSRTFEPPPGHKALLPRCRYELHCACSVHPVGKYRLSKVLDGKIYVCIKCKKVCFPKYSRDQIKEMFG
jgi:predicted SprT family Zn-dependent metalloprotease